MQQGLRRGAAIAAGVTLAREFGNRPGNVCTPTWLGQQAKKLGKQFDLEVEVLDRKEIEKLGMGSFLAVAQGSDEPPRFIVARYDGAAKIAGAGRPGRQGHHLRHRRHLAQARRRDGRDEVRHVRRGERARHAARGRRAEGASVNLVVPRADLRQHAERQAPSSRATSSPACRARRSRSSTPTPKGRLILCDALTYAERFKPAVVVDVATLTGACVIALGHHHSGLFTRRRRASPRRCSAASQAALDPCWRMPLDEEYDEALKSNFADMAQRRRPRRRRDHGGDVPAPLHAKYPWAHLDIAGTAWKSGAAEGRDRPAGAACSPTSCSATPR